MAIERVVFRTHEGDAEPRAAFNDAIKPGYEGRRCHHSFVVGGALVEQGAVPRSPPKFMAEEHIGNIAPTQPVAERLTVEVRGVMRVWRAPHVGDRRDARVLDDADELLAWQVRVANR